MDRDALDPVGVYPDGISLFSRMICRWMDGNGWSHPTMAQLATACMGGTGWLHTSSIAGLRHGTTRNPGPRTFVAIERLNYFLWRYTQTRQLIPNTESSNLYANATPILENGEPPELGWFVEVFCGYRLPMDFNVGEFFFSEQRAVQLSKSYGRLMRQLFARNGHDLVDDMQAMIRKHYPVSDNRRIQRLRDLILGTTSLNPEEMELELPSLVQFSQGMGGPATEDGLVAELRD